MTTTVTLLTDFGDQDGFVGAMRGVILAGAPRCRLVDLAHHVPPGDIRKAGSVLRRAAPCFPEGTIHLVVVDPTVGSARRPLVVQAAGHLFVAPDNGVLGAALSRLGGAVAAYVVRRRDLCSSDASSTFHGRDVFAPTAAALARGCAPAEVGPPAGELVALPRLGPGAVVEVDRFGNLLTDLVVRGPTVVRLGGVEVAGPARSYADVAPGELVLLVGSEGTLEVAVRDGSAAERLGAGVGTPVACGDDPRRGESDP